MALKPPALLSGILNAVRSMGRSANNWSMFQFIRPNYAGTRVTHEQAFQVSAVWACIDVIASALASSDWNVYGGVRGADRKEALPDDNLHYVLNTRWNPEMTAQAGKRATGIAAVGFGNGYAEIERDMARRVVALWPIQPDRVMPLYDETGRFVYRVTQTTNGGTIDLDPSDVYHVRGASLRGFAGDDAIARSIQSIAMSVAIDQFGAAYFANGTQLGGVLEYPNKMDDATYARTKEQWNERHQGVRKSFRVGILEGGLKFTPISTDAQKAQMIEAKYQQIEEVCRWFRVPPHKIAHLLRATNNNIEHQGLEFSRDTLRPWVREIEQEADYKLFPARGAKKFVELDMDWAEQGDYGSRMTAYSTARGMGVFSVNDVLRKLGENTIGPVGDVRTMNGAAVRLEDVGKNMTPAAAPAPARAQEAANEEQPIAASWMEATFARILRRFDNRARADGQDAATADFDANVEVHLGEMKGALGHLTARAATLAVEVAARSMTPTEAAAAVFTKDPQ